MSWENTWMPKVLMNKHFVAKCSEFFLHAKYLTSSITNVFCLCHPFSWLFSESFLFCWSLTTSDLEKQNSEWLALRFFWANRKDMALNTEAHIFFLIGLKRDSCLLGVEFSCWSRSSSLGVKRFPEPTLLTGFPIFAFLQMALRVFPGTSEFFFLGLSSESLCSHWMLTYTEYSWFSDFSDFLFNR